MSLKVSLDTVGFRIWVGQGGLRWGALVILHCEYVSGKWVSETLGYSLLW